MPQKGWGLLYRIGWHVFELTGRVYLRWEVEGRQHIPAHGPVIIASNHVSFLDPPLVGAAVPRQVNFMAKEELFRIAPLGWVLDQVCAFPVKRGQADRTAIRRALQVLEEGRVLGLFPEGTRSASGELGALQGGIALLALKSGAPVVPVAVLGTHLALPPGRRLPRRTPIRIRFGPPLYVQRGEGANNREALTQVSRQISNGIAQLIP